MHKKPASPAWRYFSHGELAGINPKLYTDKRDAVLILRNVLARVVVHISGYQQFL